MVRLSTEAMPVYITITMELSYTVIAKVFRQADSEETGTVDATIVPDLAAKVIGAGVRESEMHLIRFKAESKAG